MNIRNIGRDSGGGFNTQTVTVKNNPTIFSQISKQIDKLVHQECSMYSVSKNVDCKDIVKKYLQGDIRNAPWEKIVQFYGCPNKSASEACVFERAVRTHPDKEAVKQTYLEDLKYFKTRGNQVIPRGQGTPIPELVQMMEQVESLFPIMKLYAVPITKEFHLHYTPDVLHIETSPVAEYVFNGKTVFVQPLLTGTRMTNGKHWMLLFMDFRNPDMWTLEFYNSCPVKHQYYLDMVSDIARNKIPNWIKYLITDEKKIVNPISKVPQIITKFMHTSHQNDDRSCGSFITFYTYCRLSGMTCEEICEHFVDNQLIYKFREAVIADLGTDDRFFWTGKRYTIAKDDAEGTYYGDMELDAESMAEIKNDLDEFDALDANYFEDY